MDGVVVVAFVGGAFWKGRRRVRLVSFSLVFSSVSRRKNGETYVPIPPPRECMRPQPTRPHHPMRSAAPQSELQPRERLHPINSTGTFRLLVSCSSCSPEAPRDVVNGR